MQLLWSHVTHLARFTGMNETMSHDEICKEIAGELQDMAGWLSGGGLSPEQFRLGLTRMEDRKLKRFG